MFKYYFIFLTLITLPINVFASESSKAKIGNNYYDTLEEAIKASTSEDTISLTSNVKLDETLEINKTVNLNLNNNNIEATQQVFLIEGGSLNLTGKGTIKETKPYYGAITLKGSSDPTKKNYSTVNVGKDITLEGWSGVFIDRNDDNTGYGILVNIDGDINAVNDVNGGTGVGVYVNGKIKHKDNSPIVNLNETTQSVTSDSNGDGKMDVNDTWGYATNFGYHALTWAYAIGEMGVTLTDDGVELGYRSEKFATLSEWLYDLLFTSKLAFEIGWDMPCDISWDENRVLIQAIWLNDLEKFREYESAYGLLPYPMYDESQEKYYTYDDCRHGTFGIPLTSPTENIEKTGLLLEALSADSYHNLIPKYLDSVVTFKLSRDEDSLEMLDYIMDGRVYDIGYAMPDAKRYSWIISEQLKNSKGALTSTVEKFTKVATSHYEKLLESYKTMGEMEW